MSPGLWDALKAAVVAVLVTLVWGLAATLGLAALGWW